MKKLLMLIMLGGLAMGIAGCSGSDSAPKTTPEGKPVEAPGAPKDGSI